MKLIGEVRQYVQFLSFKPQYVSDRRIVKLVDLLKFSCYTNNRMVLSMFDCLVIEQCLQPIFCERKHLILYFFVNNFTEVQTVESFDSLIQYYYSRICLALTGNSTGKIVRGELNNLQVSILLSCRKITILHESVVEELLENLWINFDRKYIFKSIILYNTGGDGKIFLKWLLETVILELTLVFYRDVIVCAETLNSRWNRFLKTPLN